ncbi:MAG: hypothetical protein QXJ19_03305 [Candidatus Bathyarchaeia archaeon]|nr:hypothetical protein [Candidatus Bathyarchaeota archaeon]
MHLLPRAWRTIDSFISEAIKEYIKKVLNIWNEELHGKMELEGWDKAP